MLRCLTYGEMLTSNTCVCVCVCIYKPKVLPKIRIGHLSRKCSEDGKWKNTQNNCVRKDVSELDFKVKYFLTISSV